MRTLISTLLCSVFSCVLVQPASAEGTKAPGAVSKMDAEHQAVLIAGIQEAAVTPTAPGETKQFPVEVCKPQGEREYLSRLTCPAGDTPSYKRLGSYGERNPLPKGLSGAEFNKMLESMMSYEALQHGDSDHHVIDGYEFACGTQKRIVYMDMYHCQQSQVHSASSEVDASSCRDHPGCLDKIVRYCARRIEHEKNVYAEVFDRARLTYFLELVGAEISPDYKVHCDEN